MLKEDPAFRIRDAVHLSAYLWDERLAARWLRNFARESLANWSKEKRGTREPDAKPSAARRCVRRTNYQKITRQSILSSLPTMGEDEESGKRYRAKIYIERFSPAALPSTLSRSPSLSWCGRRPAAPNGVTLKERRATEIIPDNHHYMQRPARNLLLNIVSGTRRLQREGRRIAMREKEDRRRPR